MSIMINEVNDKIIIELPANIDRKSIFNILSQLQIENIASKINLSDEEIWNLSEKIKERWMEKEGKKILDNV